ncbi:hypothetical protein BJ980_000339 [Nocardioides daedukensis]|uniref:DUF541 domain-containing protein n=1 Tax=Nocardioides daedukensis TaxID=634462 RepID=A0A7Y9UPE6_9ACTN|nr:hypothetical protein [Nocardioides daedukensis]
MDTSLSISPKSILLAVAVLLALVAAWLLGTGEGQPATAVMAGDEKPRSIVMVGEGKTSVVPDQVSFRVTVKRQARNLDDALASSARRLDRVVGALAKHGVQEKHVTSTGLDMAPHYQRIKGERPKLDGYVVTQQAQVTVPELAKAGGAITAAVEAGGTSVRVNGIALEIGDPEAAMAAARDDAVKQATAKAKRYSQAAGNTLGPVLSMAEVERRGFDLQSFPVYGTAALSGATDEVSIHAGESEVAVRLKVTWELE